MDTGRRQTEGMQKRSSTPALVIVVNDNPDQLALLCAALQKTGLDARGFHDAGQALAAISPELPPALIITDLCMRGLDGWQFCRLLRSAEYAAFNQIPILVVSATFTGEEPKRIATALGVYAFLASPVDNDAFTQQVLEILRGQRMPIPQRTLIIEASKHQAALLGNAFAAEGFTVDTALTVREAEEAISRTAYDITIIEHSLPDGSGDVLLKRFRDTQPDCVCIMTTADPQPELSLGWMNKGAAACVRKPFEPSYLLQVCDQTRKERSLMRIEKLQKNLAGELKESRERFKALTSSEQDAIIMHDTRGAITFWNPAAELILGYTPQEVMGKHLHDLLLPHGKRDSKTSPAPHTKDSELAGHKTKQLQVRCKDGREIEIELTLTAVNLEDGQHTVGIIRDVTERKHAEEALRESEKNISNFLNSIDASVTSYSIKNSRFIYVSPSTENVYGRTIDECIRNKFTAIDYVHPDDLDILHDITTKMTEHGSGEGECRIIKPDGSIAWVHAQVKLLRDENGDPDRIDRVITDISARKELELQLLKSKEEQSGILDAIDDIVMSASVKERNFTYLSPSFAKLFGNNIEEHLQNWHLWIESVHPDDRQLLYKATLKRTVEGISEQEFRIIKPDGDIAWVRARSKVITDKNGEPDRMQRILTDITRYKQAEQQQEKLQAQLLQSQKMESVGRLAGGIAHDFNNMLSVIIGHADLALRCLAPGQPLHKTFTQICKTAERAGVLTRELLAFAGKQTIAPEVLDVNESIEGMLTMLRRLIGDHINLVWQPGENLDPVKIDPSQINHVLAEVCLNAKDAVNDGGTITITTGSASINEFLCTQQPSLVPGEYITLTISDDGRGMDSETLANIFEPFFTRKELGKGLGMATVYGIVEQNNGFINIASEPGIGTCVTIYLPQYTSAKPLSLVPAGKTEPPAEDIKTILLVEDEPENLEMFRTMLESMGYRVLAAGSPQECLRLAQSHTGRIDLLITDVVMPEMNGRELADTFIATHPSTQCLFMSGYSAEVITRNGILVNGINFIEKPFTLQKFADKIKKILSNPDHQHDSNLTVLRSGLTKPH